MQKLKTEKMEEPGDGCKTLPLNSQSINLDSDSILQELMQNAVDAGAKEITFLFDESEEFQRSLQSSHPTAIICEKDLKACKEICEVFEKGHYERTLLSFPLRQEDNKSEISELVFDEDMVNSLFDSFKLDAKTTLLFLKNLEKVETYIRKMGQDEPQLQFRVQIPEQCLNEFRSAREEVVTKIEDEAWKHEAVENRFIMSIERTLFHDSHVTKKEVNSWIVSQHYSNGKLSTKLQVFEEKEGLPLALPMVSTSLERSPAFINGYFKMDQNRHHWIWTSWEQTFYLIWNRYLLQEALPKAFQYHTEAFLQKFQENNSQALTVYDPTNRVVAYILSYMDHLNTTDKNWQYYLKDNIGTFYEILGQMKLFHTSNNQWVQWDEAVFNLLEQRNVDIDTQSVILKVTNAANRGTVTVPGHVMQGFKKFCGSNIKEINVNLVRECLLEVQNNLSLTKEECVSLLQYIGPQDVEDLKLLPLADGTMTTFKKSPLDGNAVEELVFIPTFEFPQALVPNFEHLFVDPDISDTVKQMLNDIATGESTQLKHFSKDHVTSLIPKVLPEEWRKENLIDWDISEQGHPTEEWMKEVWIFLKRHHPEDLSDFHGLHLIPSMEEEKKQLFKIDQQQAVILRQHNGRILPKHVETAITKVGGHVLPSLIKYLEEHKEVMKYVHSSLTASNLLKVFSSLLKKNPRKFISSFESLCTEEKRAVREFLIKNDDGKQLKDATEILKQLPLFETIDRNNTDSKFVSVDQVEIAAPQSGRLDVQTPQQLLDLVEEDAIELAAILDVKPMSELEFFEEIVLKHLGEYERKERDRLIRDAILKNDPDLDKLLKEYPCIPVSPHGKTFKSPTELINPRGDAASLYSLEDGRFPYEPPKGYGHIDFNSMELSDALHRLGMVKKDLPWDEVVERCKSVQTLAFQDGCRRSQTLLHYMQWKLDHGEEIDNSCVQKAQTALVATEFLPVEKTHAIYPCLWKGDGSEEKLFYAPNEVFLLSNMPLLGSVYPIVDISVFPHSKETVPKFLLLLDKEIPVEAVLQQLVEITKCASDTDDATLQKTCSDIYSYLESQCGKSNDISKLSEERIILANEHFMAPERCAFKLGFASCTPYLFEINQSKRNAFGNFFEAAGVEETIPTGIYFKVLCELAKNKNGSPLDSQELDLVVNIMRKLAILLPELKLPNLFDIEKMFGMLYIPDESGIMQWAKEMCFMPDELSWIQRKADMIFVHKETTPDVAEKLKIKTTREHLTNRFSKPIQHKNYLDAISEQLKAFPCDFGILKELLQCADEAEATEIHFVIDARYHNAERLMSDDWEQLQGPALLVYNDKPTTQSDMNEMQSLEEGSNDLTKTGQYGVGFNCVYHLTDVPTFMTTVEGTGTVLCAFDPHCQYVPGADQDVHGQMFEDCLRADFPDAFAPFLQDEFNIEHGTVFRFPLRHAQMAKQSKFVTKDNTKLTQNPEVLKEMLMEFKSEMSHCLLFLTNVKTIKISEVEDGKLKHIYSVHSALDPAEKDIQTRFSRHEKNQAKRVKDGEMKVVEVPYEDASYRLELKTSDGKKESWLITKCIGYMGNEGIKDDVKEALDREGLLPRGAIATQFNCLQNSSRLFCFLSLPVKTSLPVHVNGHFALNSDNRHDLWTDEGKGYRTTWNTLLFTNTLARAYASLLLYMKNYILSGNLQDQLPWYYNLFPSPDQTSLYLKDFVRLFYQTISTHEEDQAVLPVIRGTEKELEWFPPCGTQNQRAFFDNLQDQIPEETSVVLRHSKKEVQKGPEREIIRVILNNIGFNLLHAPMEVYGKFKEAGIEVNEVTPKAVLKFFLGLEKGTSACCLRYPQKVKDKPFDTVYDVVKLLKYCRREESYFLDSLTGLPLMVLQDESITKFSDKDKKFLTHFSKDLVPEKPTLFLHSEMLSVFSDDDISSTNVFKRLTTADLADLLKHVRGLTQSNGNPYKDWHPEYKRWPRRYWFFHLWKFLQSEAEALLGKELKIEYEEQNQQLNELLEPLSTWNLLPAVQEDQGKKHHLLIPPEKSFLVADFNHGDEVTKPIRTIFTKIGMAKPDFDIIHLYKKGKTTVSMAGGERLVRLLVGSIETPDRLIMALKMLGREYVSEKLEKREAVDVLKYMTENLAIIQQVPNNIEILQNLPFYPTVCGDLIYIYKKNVSVLPADVPTDELLETSFSTYLQDDKDLQDLYEYLGCRKSIAEIYCDFISNFEMLGSNAKMVHLRYLSGKFDSFKEQEKEALSEKLRECKCIRDSNNEWKSPSELYDVDNAVFEAMETENLIPVEYAVILPFLRKVGLIHEVTAALFENYCRAVEAEAKISTNETLAEKANVLLQHLFGRENLISSGVLEKIRAIYFLPPTRVEEKLYRLYKQYGMDKDETLSYFCFEGSVFPSSCDTRLVWTNTAILSSEADPHTHIKETTWDEEKIKRIVEILGACTRPDMEKVVDHVALLCNHFATEIKTMKRDEKQTFQDTINCIYSYLDQQQIPEHLRAKLQGIPLVLVDNRETLVKLKQIATEAEDWADIPPYLFNIQPTHKGLFEKLGATKGFIPEQYCFVLESLYKESKGEELQPAQVDIAKSAIYGFFYSQYKIPKESSHYVDNIHLLCSCGEKYKLVSIGDLLWIDEPSFEESVRESGRFIMVPLKELERNVPEIHCENFLKRMSQNMKLKTLTELLDEHPGKKEAQLDSEFIDKLLGPFKGLCIKGKKNEVK